MAISRTNLIVWDLDGTLIPADLRWLRRAIAATYELAQDAVVFPAQRVHGHTDESIVIDTAIGSGVSAEEAEAGIPRFYNQLRQVMEAGRSELAREQRPYTGATETLAALQDAGFVQTVLTGNIRTAAELKLNITGLAEFIDTTIGAFGSDARDRFDLPAVVARRFASRYLRPLDPRRTVLVGDAQNDVATARHAGFHVIAVGHRLNAEELRRYAPDLVLDGLVPEVVLAAVSGLVE